MPPNVLEHRKQVLDRLRPRLDWFENSGIQAPAGHADEGGVYAWIDEATGKPSFLYSEITGYFITLCVHLARIDPEGGWLARAVRAADWITDVALDEGGAIRCRKYSDQDKEKAQQDPYSFVNQHIAYFDCAMVGYGLVLLHNITKNTPTEQRSFLETAERIGQFCLRAFESTDRKTRYAVFDLRKGQCVDASQRWSAHFGPFELKSAMFLQALGAAAGDKSYGQFLDRILGDAIAMQHASGRFPTTLDRSCTHLHPHCYTIEGFIYLAVTRQDETLLEPALSALDWMFGTCLQPDSLVQQWSEQSVNTITQVRSDALAQALRAYYLCKRLRPRLTWSWEKHIATLEELLDGFLLDSGGTKYGQDEYGQKTQHSNAWCHMFNVEMRLFRHTGHDLGTGEDIDTGIDALLDPSTFILT